MMKRIESFCVNHLKLEPGLYVSRRDGKDGVDVTTFDIRVTTPNVEPVMDMPSVHTIEHLGATYLRNSARKDDVIYFGPMGCRTGFYLVMFGGLCSEDVVELVRSLFEFIVDYEGDIPGATPIECGNYSEQNLTIAKYYARKYLRELEEKRFVYAE